MRTLLLIPILSGFLVPTAWSRPVTYQNATSVLGQPNFTTDTSPPLGSNTFDQPEAIVIEPVTQKVFISDYSGSRILRFSSIAAYQNFAAAEAVLGQTDFDQNSEPSPPTASSLDGPGGMAFDSQGNLYVADYGNSRVLRWNNPTTIGSGSPADVVIGQADLTSNVLPSALPHSNFSGPWLVAIDASDNLYVGDYSLHRVLRFANAPSVSGNMTVADAVFGQPDLSGIFPGTDPGAGPALTSGIFRFIWGLHIDSAGRLWVGDTNNNRILRFDDAANKTSGALPDGVLGQADFASADSGAGASGLHSPFHMALDADGTLWVSDYGNGRVVGYKNAGTRPATGANPANYVLGAASLTAPSPSSISGRTVLGPYGVTVTPAGGLFVADGDSHRVLHFRNESPILEASLSRQIAAAKKRLKKAKKAGKKALVHKLNAKIGKLNARLRSLD